MVKITTKQQFELLIKSMEANPTLARGVRAVGQTKPNVEAIWREIAQNLNNSGPPTRTPDEWQRVWIHFKAKLKKKILQNQINFSTTGGEPSQEVTLSPLEQAAEDILHMELIVNPVGNVGVLQTLNTEEPLEIKLEIDQPLETDQQKGSNPTKLDNVYHTPKKSIKIADKKVNFLPEKTDTETEILNSLKKIEQTLYRKNEIMEEVRDLKRKKCEILKEIQELKKRKYEVLVEDQELDRKIKQKKLEILEKQLQRND